MIVKQITCHSAKAGILYAGNKKDSKLLMSNDCFGSPEEIGKQFTDIQSYNSTTNNNNKTYHVTIAWHKDDDVKLTESDKTQISKDYANKMGFEKNQWVSYEHSDGKSPHVHFIANRINVEGKAVSLSHNYYRHEEFCREKEKQYNLKIVKTKERNNKFQSLENHRKIELKTLIDKHIKKSKDMTDFKARLSKENIKVFTGRGISYQDQDKAKFKGSTLGRDYSLKNTENRLELNQNNELEL